MPGRIANVVCIANNKEIAELRKIGIQISRNLETVWEKARRKNDEQLIGL